MSRLLAKYYDALVLQRPVIVLLIVAIAITFFGLHAPDFELDASADSLVLDEDAALRWFEASGTARRGFCRYCGSTLLWAPRGKNYVCVAAGAIDQGPAIAAARHVYVADRAAYEFIGDGLPGSPGSMHDERD